MHTGPSIRILRILAKLHIMTTRQDNFCNSPATCGESAIYPADRTKPVDTPTTPTGPEVRERRTDKMTHSITASVANLIYVAGLRSHHAGSATESYTGTATLDKIWVIRGDGLGWALRMRGSKLCRVGPK